MPYNPLQYYGLYDILSEGLVTESAGSTNIIIDITNLILPYKKEEDGRRHR